VQLGKRHTHIEMAVVELAEAHDSEVDKHRGQVCTQSDAEEGMAGEAPNLT
jgi:hypothetical protein